MELNEQRLADIEKRATVGGFTFLWPSEVLTMIEEIRSLRKRLDQAEWNEEMAIIALEHACKEKSITEETKHEIEHTVRRLIRHETGN